KGLSHIAAEYDSSDRRKFWVPCHECGEHHVLSWDNVHWMDGAEQPHEVYGLARPETAMYRCPHCSVLWNDNQKNANVRRGEWRAERPSRGIAGFYLNELYSPFPGSRLARLVERYLEAKYHEEMGDEREMIVFINSCLGLPYEQASTLPDADDLAERGLDYRENTVPQGGLILTAGVDVQHDRLAIIIRAWGREEESWLVFWGEIYGNCIDKNDPVWETLDSILFRAYEHETARLDLEGTGAGRMHWYQTVRGDYYRQITAEVLAPSRQNPRKKTWQKKVNERNEALDCEVYALHASRRLKVHLLRGDQWDDVEKRVLQADLFTNTTTAPALPQKKRR
ncbi:Terminase, partial [Durusdinium trenchii]